MKRPMFSLIIFMAALFSPDLSLSQAEATAVPFLLVPPAPEGLGIGGASAALPTTDAIATLVNPGQLGVFSLTNLLNAGTYAPRSDWLPQLQIAGMSYGVSALNAGYNFRSLLSLPCDVSVGLGYSRLSVDLGTFNLTAPGGPTVIGTFRAREYADTYSLGIGLAYVVRVGLGFNFKRVVSELSPVGTEMEQGTGTGKSSATDFGVLVDVPIVQIASEVSGASLDIGPRTTPFLDLSWAYVKANVGPEMTYVNPSQADPLPRTAVLGLSLGAGARMNLESTEWELASIRLVHQAEDLLVTRNPDGTIGYRTGAGGIRFWNDVFLGSYNGLVTSRRGWQVQVGEFFSWREGSVESPGLSSYATSGYSISLGGFLKCAHALARAFGTDVPWLAFAMEHVDLQFHSGKYDLASSDLGGNSAQSLNLVIKGFSF